MHHNQSWFSTTPTTHNFVQTQSTPTPLCMRAYQVVTWPASSAQMSSWRLRACPGVLFAPSCAAMRNVSAIELARAVKTGTDASTGAKHFPGDPCEPIH
jgi:hypothetical protein